jgi:hypothetical protein
LLLPLCSCESRKDDGLREMILGEALTKGDE